jgi:hypothetical protein
MSSSPNRLLALLSESDFDLLAPILRSVTLGLRKQLEKPNRRIEAVYFPESGFASVVALQKGKEVEIGLIGREGMTGLPIVLGNHRSRTQPTSRRLDKGSAFLPRIFARQLAIARHCGIRC